MAIETDTTFLEVTEKPLELERLYQFVVSASCGAVNIFAGTVRNQFDSREVRSMEYHGYPEMAEKELAGIATEAFSKWEVERIAVQHRLGHLKLTEQSVVIAVSAPHRVAALDSGRYIIEEIKKRLPIWKKEHFVDGKTKWKHVDLEEE